MLICVIMYGCAAKPELDEIRGYIPTSEDAKRYCDHKNQFTEEGWSFWYEETKPINF